VKRFSVKNNVPHKQGGGGENEDDQALLILDAELNCTKLYIQFVPLFIFAFNALRFRFSYLYFVFIRLCNHAFCIPYIDALLHY